MSSLSSTRAQKFFFLRSIVPDHIAYSLVFRLLANRTTPQDRGRARSYLRMALECATCGNQETRINGFLAVVAEFERRVGPLDRRAKEVHEQNPQRDLTPAEYAELETLQRQKEAIVTELMALLPARLGAEGTTRLQQHISERVKRKVKIYPEHIHSVK